MAEFETEHLIPTFKRLENILAKNSTGYFVGKKVGETTFCGILKILHLLDFLNKESLPKYELAELNRVLQKSAFCKSGLDFDV